MPKPLQVARRRRLPPVRITRTAAASGIQPYESRNRPPANAVATARLRARRPNSHACPWRPSLSKTNLRVPGGRRVGPRRTSLSPIRFPPCHTAVTRRPYGDAMETAKLVQLTPQNGRLPSVRVEANLVVVDHLVLDDHALAAFVADRPAEERALLVERALRVGLTAIASVGVTVNVDAVRAEFQGLLRQTEAANEKAATALDQMLRQNFADGEGRLPRTLEKFLGDKGQLRGFVDDLFDEGKRDSAIGRMKVLLGAYFDGDASKLAQLLDPTRLGSPLHQFRVEMAEGFNRIGERLAALEAAGAARAGERAKGSAKGVDFEEIVDVVLGARSEEHTSELQSR